MQMSSRKRLWPLLALATLTAETSACSGTGSDDSGGGSANAGSPGGSGGAVAGNSAGGQATGGTSGSSPSGMVDCEAVCAHVKTLCSERAEIDDVWLSACKSACDARVQLTPDTARLEQTCVDAAVTCNASIACVATPR